MEATFNSRKHFTEEKKELIIKEHYSERISIPVLARKYAVHAITLYNWKRQMNHRKDQSPINVEFVQKLFEENDTLKGEVESLKAKVGDLTIKNDILKDGLEIENKSDLKNTWAAKEVKALNRYEVTQIADAFEVSRSTLYYEPVSQEEVGMPRYYQKSKAQLVLEEIKTVLSIRATFGYRRVTTMVNRQRALKGRNNINRKHLQRITRINGLTLPQTMPHERRPHTGLVMTFSPNIHLCSDGMEIRCFNGDKVFLAFALDCCDHEAFTYVARTEPLSAMDIEELMVKAVEARFGSVLRCPRDIQWLSDRGSIYRAKSVKALGRELNLQCCYTRAYSRESNGMAEAFVKTIKRDYVYQADCDSAESVLKLLPQWFADYNNVASHSALGMKSPVEYKKSINF